MTSHPMGHPDPDALPEFYEGVAVKRTLAWVFDVILIAVLSAVLLPFTAFTALFFFPVFMLVISFFYRWFALAGGSATWGMRLLAIELREADGGPLTSRTAFLHTLAYSVAIVTAPLQVISAIMMGVTPRCQGLGDFLLGTAAMNRRA
jgi:uncharacterized RDD family membrane protein YckC